MLVVGHDEGSSLSYKNQIPDDAHSEEESQDQETRPPQILLPRLLLQVPEDHDTQEETRGGPGNVTNVADLENKCKLIIGISTIVDYVTQVHYFEGKIHSIRLSYNKIKYVIHNI